MSSNNIFDEMDEQLFVNKVTISLEKRNGKKCITNVIGMAEELDLKKILSYLKKKHNCNGSIVNDEKYGEVMLFSGDQKENIYNFLIDEEIYKKDDIIVKGI
jgi:translation initiation factor SUI1